VASLRPAKAYPLMAAKLQLGEFAGYVRLDATGDADDCYVLLDASRQVNPKSPIGPRFDSASATRHGPFVEGLFFFFFFFFFFFKMLFSFL
jgi:hypothetical protein